MRFAGASGYASALSDRRVGVYSVQENYLDVVDLQYYRPKDTVSDPSLPSLPNGDVDIVKELYRKSDP